MTIDGFEDVPKDNGDALKKAIAHQPVSVAICASTSLQLYHSGVVGDDACCQELNHGVLAVGYDDGEADGLEPHYIIKVRAKRRGGGGTRCTRTCRRLASAFGIGFRLAANPSLR